MSKPRTPRYWPRMKVRGARRKRNLLMYRFQRLGDVGHLTAVQLTQFSKQIDWVALSIMQLESESEE